MKGYVVSVLSFLNRRKASCHRIMLQCKTELEKYEIGLYTISLVISCYDNNTGIFLQDFKSHKEKVKVILDPSVAPTVNCSNRSS